MDIVILTTYTSRIEAEIAKGLLESEGIRSFISGDRIPGIGASPAAYSGMVQLKVMERDATKAQTILEEQTAFGK